MRAKLILPVIALALLGLAISHVVRAAQAPPKPPPPIEPSRSPYRDTIAGAGIVEPRSENIAVGAHLPGVVAEVFVQVGDPVQVGTKLFSLDDRHLQRELAVRRASLASAEANLAKLVALPRPEEVPAAQARVREARASLEDARDQARRATGLIRSEAMGAEEVAHRQKVVQIADAQLARAEADLNLLNAGAWEADKQIARAAVAQAKAQLEQTQTEIDRLTVQSRINGQVLQRNVRPGEYVGTTPDQTLLILGDMSRTHVRVDIDEADIPRFRPGLGGRAVPRGAPDVDVPLVFVRVEPYVVPKRSLTGGSSERVDTRVLQVICAVERGDAPLYVGQQVDVYLNTSENVGTAVPK